MQLLYWEIVDLQSAVGSEDRENSMHSSRFDFSSVQTQQGYTLFLVSIEYEYGFMVARAQTFGLEGASELAAGFELGWAEREATLVSWISPIEVSGCSLTHRTSFRSHCDSWR